MRIGISGWTYAPWRGVFYPEGLPHAQELRFAAGAFQSIEINGTFYGLQRPQSFMKWARETPDGFVFAVKAPRFITHLKRLKDVEQPLANFFASGVLGLEAKLGPVLWQLPPNLHFDEGTLAQFLRLLPPDTESAARLARRHDSRVEGRTWFDIEGKRPLRHAMEIRHVSFVTTRFTDLLRAHHVALVCADSVAWPRLMDVTADFVYCRLHGSEEIYASGYDSPALDAWADRVVAWAMGGAPQDGDRIDPRPVPLFGRDVFVFFDNDQKVRAPADARVLNARVQQRLAAIRSPRRKDWERTHTP